MGRGSTAIKVDVSRPEDVELMFQKGLQDFGRIDILVDDASIRPQPRGIEIPLDDVLCNL